MLNEPHDWPAGWARDIFYAGPVKCPAAVSDIALDHLGDAYWYDISGESYRKPALRMLLGSACKAIVVVTLQREPENPKDPHAVAVKALFAQPRRFEIERVIADQIGYIPRQHSRRVAEYLLQYESRTTDKLMLNALLMQWHDEDDRQGFTARLCSDAMKEMTLCVGVTKKGTPCRWSAVEGLLTCTVHDPDRAKKQTARPRAPKVTVIGEEWRFAEEVRKGDLVLESGASANGRFPVPRLVISVETRTVLECTEIDDDEDWFDEFDDTPDDGHTDWCAEWRDDPDADWVCPQTTVLVRTIGPRGGDDVTHYELGEQVRIAVTS